MTFILKYFIIVSVSPFSNPHPRISLEGKMEEADKEKTDEYLEKVVEEIVSEVVGRIPGRTAGVHVLA